MNKKQKNAFWEILQKLFQPTLHKITGMKKYDEEIESLYYVINNAIDITTFPKATGLLRQVQLCDAELLRIFHELCQKHNLCYWLDYGTLLGCVRHKGFIPWDDDLDVAMPREDYEKIKKILPAELEQYGITVPQPQPGKAAITVWNAGMVLDIFPVDTVIFEAEDNRNDLKKRLYEYRVFYNKNKKNISYEQLINQREKIIGKPQGNKIVWYHNMEFCADSTIYEPDTIFPLRKLNFEGYGFFVPNDYDTYLREHYGDYMAFPRGGILHHNAAADTRMHENSRRKGIDIDDILNSVKNIHI